MNNSAYYNITAVEAVQALQTDIKDGLAPDEAARRLLRYGRNQLQEKETVSWLAIFADQFRDFIIWILIAAAGVSGFLQEWIDAAAIVLIVFLNAILGFIQEFRAEKSLAALKKLSAPMSKVVRNGTLMVVPSAEIVPGDLLELEAGDIVPADARITYVSLNFTSAEASLTGESFPVEKTALELREKKVPLAERANMVYMGTTVAQGKGRAVVVETGMRTELGKIAGMIQTEEKEITPLQKKLEEFGKWIVYICFGLVGMVFMLEYIRGGELINTFLTAVSLAVAAIPEGLPAVVTVALALGVQRMVKRNVLIRKLRSVETLGSTTVICSDKTGTLTKNEMTVKSLYFDGKMFDVAGVGYQPKGEIRLAGKKVGQGENPTLDMGILCGVLCNSAELILDMEQESYRIVGDPTEASLLTCAAKMDVWKKESERQYSFLMEIPFDSVRKKMTVVRKRNGKNIVFCKGAPDVLLSSCIAVEEMGQKFELSEKLRDQILSQNNNLANKALRVIAVAYKELDQLPEIRNSETIESGLTFLGLMAMIDPPREEVKEAISVCKTAGIRVVMITGDHKNTAAAIARELGIIDENSIALSGEDIDAFTDDDFNDKVRGVSVYARVSPEHKLKIVKALREQGEIVAMSGDGVNDAPALKESDIGVAMGITGTDVTKEVSDMVITDDNFTSIVRAVEEGRGIYDNIKKIIHYLLSCNVGEILVMFVSSLIGLPIPLFPIQILWINLVTDGFPALALGVDPAAPDVMLRAPRSPKEGIVTVNQGVMMLMQGSLIAAGSLSVFAFILFVEQAGLARARTAAFLVLSISQIFHAFNCRSSDKSILEIGLFSNMKLIYAALFSFSLQLLVVFLPFLQIIFKTTYLTWFDWSLVIVVSSFPLLIMEAVKRAHIASGHTL